MAMEAVHAGQFERIPVQVDGVGIVGVVIECQAVALSFLQFARRALLLILGITSSGGGAWRSSPKVV